MTSSQSVCAIVPAAGVGKRMGADCPKQYLHIAGKTILEHTLALLHSHPAIEHVFVAVGPNDEYFDDLSIATAPWLTRVDGGKERADSVLSALNSAKAYTWALVHDAARPCLTHQDLDALLEHRSDNAEGGAILAAPVRDTMKRSTTGTSPTVTTTVDRDQLWHALTPQLCRTDELTSALSEALSQQATVTDEASALEWADIPVRLIEGDASNLKITRPEDLGLATFFLQQQGRA